MIVLEGPDGSGKSMLGEHLSNILGREFWHPGGAVSDELVPEWMKKCEHKLEQGFILDRTTHISEFVYGPIINKREPVTFKDMTKFLKLCGEKNWKIVYCRPASVLDFNHTKSDYDTDEQIKAVEDNHQKIVAVYDELFCSPRSSFLEDQGCLFTFDYEQKGSFQQLLKFLEINGK